DAESLMRSRYSAFVLQRASYLLNTWDSGHRPAEVVFDVNTKWLGLEVKTHRIIDHEHAEVEFVARYRVHGKASRLQERSRFVCKEGRWYYIDGI
ncbi:MAG: YchJ family protein, partial [Betaproteobacteria bacterium]